jgi:hypothetical protein
MKEENYRLGNRMYGLTAIVLGGLAISADNLFGEIVGTVMATEGAGDLVTGYHHFVSTNLLRLFSKGKIDIRYYGDPKFKEENLEDKLI